MSQQQGKPPYYVHVDQANALELVKHGASLLALDMPEYTVLGFDLQMLSVGPLFKGVKMIPPGPHFIYYSPTDRHGPNQPFFTGFFIHPNPGDVIVRRWDPVSETLIRLADPDEEERYQFMVRHLEMDRHLGAYDLHHYNTWKRLSSYITLEVIERLEPVAADISVMHEADFADTLSQTTAERCMNQHLAESRTVLSAHAGVETSHDCNTVQADVGMAMDGIHERQRTDDIHMNVDNETSPADKSNMVGHRNTEDDGTVVDHGSKPSSGRCFYTRFSHLVKRHGIDSAMLTRLNVDKSSELESLLKHHFKESEELFLGELQFSFIAFLMGQSLESFGQWKSMVCLMLSCDEAPLSKRTQLFVKFLDLVCFQFQVGLKADHSDTQTAFIDESWFSDDNFFRLRFKEFYQTVTEAHPVDGDLLKQTRRLKGIVESFLGWNFEPKDGCVIESDDDDEYAPVIVPESELSSHGQDG